MIYLKEDGNEISENIITSNNKKITDKLFEELSLEDNYNIIDVKRYLGNPYIQNEESLYNLITYNHIGFNGPGYQDYIYIRKEMIHKYPMSYMILKTLDSDYEVNLAKLLNINSTDISKLIELISYNSTKKDYIIRNMYQDLYIFMKEINDNINIQIKDISKIYHTNNHLSELEQTAINNTNILKLIRK